MAKAVTPQEIQSAMAVYASDDETRLRAGGDETDIVALSDGGTHRVDEMLRTDARSSTDSASTNSDETEDEPPAFPV